MTANFLSLPELLLIVQTLVFGIGFLYLFKRDPLFGIFFFFLGVYAVPAQIGYFYFSEISVLIQAYFSIEPWYTSAVFISLSASSFLLLFAFCRRSIFRLIPIALHVTASRYPQLRALLACVVIFGLACFEIGYLILHFPEISWFTAQAEASLGVKPGYFLFVFIFKLLVPINLVLYVLIRQHVGIFRRGQLIAMLVFFFSIFVLSATKLGNRTDLLALALGVVTFEAYAAPLSARRIFGGVIAVAGLLVGLILVESLRYSAGRPSTSATALILLQDYYPPAHMLFAAVAFDLIDSLNVIKSNLSNALVMLKEPLLQNAVTDHFNPGVATRSAGYGFYLLTEGYLFAGRLGFAYNAIVMLLGLSLWRRLARSNSQLFNTFLLAIMGCMLVNLVRSQSAYFIKYLYLFILPGTMLYLCFSAKTVGIRWLWRLSERSE